MREMLDPSPLSQQAKAPAPPETALVLGGGFAGVEVAIKLRKAGISVTLVSERPQLFVYPTSIWVVTGEHRVEQSLMDLAELAQQHQFDVVFGKVDAIYADYRIACVDGREFSADILVLALGAGRRPIPGIEHTLTIWGAPEDTVTVSHRLSALIEKGRGKIAVGFGDNPADPSAVRSGPAFEVMFNIVQLLRRLGLRERFELSFFAPIPDPGVGLGERASAQIVEQLNRLGVSLRFGKPIDGFDETGVKLEGGAHVNAELVIFVPAGTGHPLLAKAGVPLNDSGFVRIDESCRVDGYENVYAIGDIAALEGPTWRMKQGHLAEAMARVAADAIERRHRGAVPRDTYLNHLRIACLMDTGDGGTFVYRDATNQRLFSLPTVGHWLKKATGYYYRWSKYSTIRWLSWATRELFFGTPKPSLPSPP